MFSPRMRYLLALVSLDSSLACLFPSVCSTFPATIARRLLLTSCIHRLGCLCCLRTQMSLIFVSTHPFHLGFFSSARTKLRIHLFRSLSSVRKCGLHYSLSSRPWGITYPSGHAFPDEIQRFKKMMIMMIILLPNLNRSSKVALFASSLSASI